MTSMEFVEFIADVLLCSVNRVNATQYTDILTADEAKAKEHFGLLVEKFPGSAWDLCLVEDWQAEVPKLLEGAALVQQAIAEFAMGFNFITPSRQVIAINMTGLPTWTQRLHVLLHECAHTVLMVDVIRGPRSEPYAETIAWMATRELLGDVSRKFSVGYVTGALMMVPDETVPYIERVPELAKMADYLVKAAQRPGTW